MSSIWSFIIKCQEIYLYQGSIYKHSFCNNSYGMFPSCYWMVPDRNIFLPQKRGTDKTIVNPSNKEIPRNVILMIFIKGIAWKKIQKITNFLSKTGNKTFAGNSPQCETVVTRILNKVHRQTHGNQCNGMGNDIQKNWVYPEEINERSCHLMHWMSWKDVTKQNKKSQPNKQPKPKNHPVSYCFQSLLTKCIGKCPTVAPGVDPAAG